jgi:hypothetical protein
MTQDEVIEIAQKCGLIGMRPHLDGIYSESLIAFANLVAAKEREACADIAENWNCNGMPRYGVAAQIRARGQTQPKQVNGMHTCPYAEEIHGDYETLCNCDEEATRQCAQDI